MIKAISYLIIAIILSVILMPIGFIIRMFYSNRAVYINNISEQIDVLGNSVCDKLFDATLIKKGGYQFGREYEKISSVIGKNILINMLSKIGKFINAVLNLFQANHSVKNIQNF